MSALSLRYARAFSQVAENVHLDAAASQLQLGDFARTLAESRVLREVLLDPSIPTPQKVKVIDGLAARLGMSPQVRNFIAVIVDHRRLDMFDEICREYAQLADGQSGIAEADIITARPLDADGRAELEGHVAELAGSSVRATYTVDPSLLGGAIVRIGSTVHDGSLRAQLEQLRETLISAPVM